MSFPCHKYGVPRDSFNRWKKQRNNDGIEALANAKPCQENPAVSVPSEIEEKILTFTKSLDLVLKGLAGIWSVTMG